MADYTLQYTAAEIDNRLGRPVPVNQGGTGQTTAYQNVSLTPNAANGTMGNVVCRYYPYLGVVLFRGWYTTSIATTANSWITIATVPTGFRPAQNAAFAVSVPGGGSGLARSNGEIEIRTFTARSAGTSVDFSGWWFV